MKKKCIAIIPARGGSKRIPRKNIRDFMGKPIIAYSIQVALASQIFDEVMVSTDDDEIARIALEYGAKVPFMREEKLADDFVTEDEVLIDTLEQYKKKGIEFEYMCCLHATAPFIMEDDLKTAYKLMIENPDMTQLIPMAQFSYPPQRCHVINDNGEAIFKYPEYITTRSQDLEKMYHDVGQFYFFHVDRFVKAKGLIFDHIVPYVVDEMRFQDIDTEQDWHMAEMKYKLNMIPEAEGEKK